MKNKKGFTLIEILLILAIVSILAIVILTSLGQAKKNARVNSAKTTLKSVVTTIVSCKDPSGSGTVNPPGETEDGTHQICTTVSSAKWPALPGGYKYVNGPSYNSVNCQFEVDTNGDTSSNLTCSCISQVCF